MTSDWARIAADKDIDKKNIAGILATSLKTPSIHWESTPTELRASFPKGQIIFFKGSAISDEGFARVVEEVKNTGVQLSPVLLDVKLLKN